MVSERKEQAYQGIGDIKHSFDSAKRIGHEMDIKSFEELDLDLRKNVTLNSSDEKNLRDLQNIE